MHERSGISLRLRIAAPALIYTWVFLLSIVETWAQNADLIFHSGFEADVEVLNNGKSADIVGRDHSLPVPNDWVNDLETNPLIGSFDIQYQGGTDEMRYAEIVSDPKDPDNKVLHFRIHRPNVDGVKGRVQANLYQNEQLRNMDYSIRLLLPSDFNFLKTANAEIRWLTLMEFWNNPAWSQDYGFRITVNLQKWGLQEDSLHLGVHGQVYDTKKKKWQSLWDTGNASFIVPVSRWMRIHVRFAEGDQSNGRFWLSVTPEGEEEEVVFDIRNYTRHPDDPAPDGLSHFNPFKLYTSGALINAMSDNGKLLHLYWDDFELWHDRVFNALRKALPESELQIGPLPAGEFLYVTLPPGPGLVMVWHWKLYDTMGKGLQRSGTVRDSRFRIARSGLPGGMYLLQLCNDNGIVYHAKLLFK